MRDRLILAGQDPEAMNSTDLSPLGASPSRTVAFERARALKEGLEDQARHRRN